jgi:siroheme synthase
MAMDWSPYAGVDTLMVLMGVENREYVAQAGRPGSRPVAFTEYGSTPRERVVESTLAEVCAGGVEVNPPAVLIARNVVRLRERLKNHAMDEVLRTACRPACLRMSA